MQRELQQVGIDPLAYPRFARCGSCGADNQPRIAYSTLLVFREIRAALNGQKLRALAEKEADLEAQRAELEREEGSRKSNVNAWAALLILVPLGIAFVWLINPPRVVPIPKPLPVVPIRQLPPFFPEAGSQEDCQRLRALGGECVSGTFRSCDDAGVVHENRCGPGAPACPEDCRPDAPDDLPGSKDGGWPPRPAVRRPGLATGCTVGA